MAKIIWSFITYYLGVTERSCVHIYGMRAILPRLYSNRTEWRYARYDLTQTLPVDLCPDPDLFEIRTLQDGMGWGPRHEVCHRSDVSLPTSCKWPPSFIAAFNFSLCQPTPIHLERGDGTQRIEVTCDRQVRNQQSHQSLVSIYHRGAAGS